MGEGAFFGDDEVDSDDDNPETCCKDSPYRSLFYFEHDKRRASRIASNHNSSDLDNPEINMVKNK